MFVKRKKMKTLNKILLVGTVLLSSCSYNEIKTADWNHPAQKFPLLKIGDRMPDFNNHNTAGSGIWKSKDGLKSGGYIKWDRREVKYGIAPHNYYTGDRKADYIEATLFCGEKTFVFGVGDFDLKVLYIDENFDGIIDLVAKLERNIGDKENTPDCQKI